MTITPAQCRAAREMLKWSREGLAPRAQITVVRLAKFENGSSDLTDEELHRIARALGEAGAKFSSVDGDERKRS